MWRIVVCFVVATVFVEGTADFEHGPILQRLKRSPHPPYCPPPPPPYWPPPPPPPFWPPPPPPPPPQWYQQPSNQAYAAAAAQTETGKSEALIQPEPAPEAYQNNQGQNSQNSQGQETASQPPCDNCNHNGNVAVSNAQSQLGNAIAVAIARAGISPK